LRHPYVS
jgi:mitogen-activated protein kinase 15